MEAIKPGSSSSVKVEHYETVCLRVDDSPYTYVSLPRSPFRSRSPALLDNLYDEPRTFLLPPPQPIQQNDDTSNRSRALSGDGTTQKNDEHSSTNNPVNIDAQSQDNPDLSDSLKETVSPADKGEDEELEKLDQYQFQLRILDQMQRLVQKLEDVSDVVGLPKPTFELPNPTQPIVLDSENTETSENQDSVKDISSEAIPQSPNLVPVVSVHGVKQDTSNGSQDFAVKSREETKCHDAQKQPDSALQSSQTTNCTIQAQNTNLEAIEESTGMKLYENLDSDGHQISIPLSVTGEKVKPDIKLPVDDNEESPRLRSRTKMMLKGEYKSPVDRRLVDQSDTEYSPKKAMISEYTITTVARMNDFHYI